MVEINGETLIERYIRFLNENSIFDIVIVVGHLSNLIIEKLKPVSKKIKFIYNPDYKMGSITSLNKAKEFMNSDCIIMDADVYFEKQLLKKLINSANNNCFLIDPRSKNTGEEMLLGVNGERVITIKRGLSSKFDLIGEGVGFLKLSKSAAEKLSSTVDSFINTNRKTNEYEEAIDELLKTEYVGYENIAKFKWTEIDFIEDVDKAVKLAIKD